MAYRPGIDYAPHIHTKIHWPASLYTPWPMTIRLSKCLVPKAEHTWIDYDGCSLRQEIFGCSWHMYMDNDTEIYGETYASASI